MSIRTLVVTLVLVASALISGPPAETTAGGRAARAVGLGGGGVMFVANAGQADPWASFVVPGEQTSVLFGADGLSVRLASPPARATACAGQRGRGVCLPDVALGRAPDPLTTIRAGQRVGDPARGTVDAVALDFVGGRRGVRPEPAARGVTTYNFFSGSRDQWRIDVPTYGRVIYRAVWPGIDVAFDGDVGAIKQTFTLAPGADPRAIRLAWRGAQAIALAADGALVVDTAGGPIVDAAPVAWQVVDGRRVAVDVRFRLGGDGDPLGYGFEVGSYDVRRPLIVDPAVLVWTGFIGAGGLDRGLGLALGPDGTVWVAGESGPSAYVARISSDGRQLLSVGILDADGEIAAFDIDVDASGAAYVTGVVVGDGGATFPAAGGPDTTYNGGVADGFVAKLTPDGKSLLYCGYIGGDMVDFGEGVAVGKDGTAVYSGLVESTEATFPAVGGPDVTQNGAFDAYVVKLKAEPTAAEVNDNYVWAGFVGGDGDDVTAGAGGWYSAGHVGLDGAGNAYMSGQTTSHEDTFPNGGGFGSLPGPDRTYNGGDWDAYIVKVKADGSGLAYAGFIGGDDYDDAKGMAIDADGAAYLTGATYSPDFPTLVGPDLTFNGFLDAFVTKVSPDGRTLVWSGFVGGDDDEQGQGVALGPDGRLYVIGRTESQASTFPVVGGPDLTHNGPDGLADEADEGDAYVGRLAADIGHADPRDNWDYMGFIGGAKADGAFWIKVDGDGNAFVVGDADSAADTFPDGDGMGSVTSWGGSQPGGVQKGGTDAFVARVDWVPPPPDPRAILPWLGRVAVRGEVPPPVVVTLTPTPTRGPTFTPRPTSTPRPTGTERPTALPTKAITPPAGEEIVFYDDFSDHRSGWDEIDSGGDVWRYVDDAFEVSTAEGNTLTAPFAPRSVRYADGALSVTARLTAATDALYGLVFGGDSALFIFAVGDGRYAIFKSVGGNARVVVGPITSTYVPSGLDTNVHLRVERDGSVAAVFIDGHRLGQVDDPALEDAGQAGFFISSDVEAPASARYDDFLVTRWGAGRATATATAGAGR